MKPTFSVIIPTYNRALLLKHCLENLVKQRYKNFEVLVCDDGSTDNTKETIEEFKTKLDIRYFYMENSGGPSKPRNIGIQNAKADWVCFLDSDDFWFENKLECVEKYIKNYEFICHDSLYSPFHQHIKKNIINTIRFIFLNYKKLDILIRGNFIFCSSVCVKKDIINKIFFNEDKRISALEDYFAWLQLFTQFPNIKYKYINKKLYSYNYDIEGDNISKSNPKNVYKLFAFKHKLKEANIFYKNSCIYYMIGNELKKYYSKKRAFKYFIFSFKNTPWFSIKIRSLIKAILCLF